MKTALTLSLSMALALSACRSLHSAGESSLLAADRSFCADTQERRLDAWLAAFDEHGSQVGADFQPITGRDAIRAHMQELFADPANELWWEPDSARVSEAGNLGATTGRFRLEQRRPEGRKETLLAGRYFDVWRKLPDGSWKLLYDIGDSDKLPSK